jgi:RNA 2',3'-cyclic 3'-phosphodiesterase
MRVFLAVEIDDEVKRCAARVSARLAAALDTGAERRSVAWVAAGNLHITLQFLGEVEPPLVREVADRLARPLAVPAFDVALAGLGTFPPSGPPRVVWLGVAEGARSLSTLYREIDARLDGLGFRKDSRPFHAHLTLGRVKAACGQRLRDAIAAAKTADAGRSRVDHVALFESRLSPSGSTYTVVAATPLG